MIRLKHIMNEMAAKQAVKQIKDGDKIIMTKEDYYKEREAIKNQIEEIIINMSREGNNSNT